MNERIRQLADEAVTRVALRCEGSMESDKHGEWIRYNDLGKFAELIVRECARIARATPCPYEEDEVRQRLGHTWDMASLEAGREIVKHFGVEP